MSPLDFFNKHGFCVASCKEQQEQINQLVEQNIVQLAKPEWLADKPNQTIYVGKHVDNKEKMPASLHHLVYNDYYNFKTNEIVEVELFTNLNQTAYALAKILKAYVHPKLGKCYECAIVGTNAAVNLQEKYITKP